MNTPSGEGCRELLRMAGAGAGLLRHVELAACAAGQLACLCRVDHASCVAGSLLHDIGRAGDAASLAARLSGKPPEAFAALDHAQLGACIVGSAGAGYAHLAGAVGRHALGSVLGRFPPEGPVEQVVYVADKLVGQSWLGFRGRMDDLERRYGDRHDIRLCVAGAAAVLHELAGRACVSAAQLEWLVARAMPAL